MLDGQTCAANCPVETFPDANNTCRSCDQQCLTFPQPSERYLVNVNESTSTGVSFLTVNAMDKRALSRPLEYLITGGNEDQFFSIHPMSGEVTLSGTLDRETQDAHTFTVTVFDVGVTPVSQQSASATVLVLVTDANDNAPVFTETAYSAFVFENSPSNISLLTVSASDFDSAPNAMLTYSIAPGVMSTNEFQLDPVSGELRTTRSFDFEQQQSYELTVLAVDSGAQPLTGIALVTVAIGNRDDVSPTFAPSEYFAEVSELASVGEEVVQVMATDLDTDNITYYLIQGNEQGNFILDPNTGRLTIGGNLDYESIQTYSLIVRASDGVTTPPTAIITVRILDENDHTPTFSASSYSTSIPENTQPNSFILQVSATDGDINTTLSYSLSGPTSSAFSVNSSGAIANEAELDFEAVPSYSFLITATDSGDPPLFSSAAVMVSLTDVNDNSPAFEDDNLSFRLSESVPVGTIVTTLFASDLDSGVNSRVVYTLQTDSSPFSVNSSTGTVRVSQPLDFETAVEHVITVIASDSGDPSLSSSATLTVCVGDVNDNPPVFTNQSYFAAIAEDELTGTAVIQILATDADNGTNAEVTYSLLADNEVFSIGSVSGLVTLARALDFEQQSLYTLTVVASNSESSVPLVSFATLTVRVVEVNELAPRFSLSVYSFSLLENQGSEVIIGATRATDGDGGTSGVVQYAIESGNGRGLFRITSDGEIITTGPADREQQELYDLVVVAMDEGIPPLSSSASVRITIIDINDSPPQFSVTVPYTVSIPENLPSGAVVVTTPPITVTDADAVGPNSQIIFSITEGNEGGVFSLDPLTGQLQVAGNIDFERRREYELRIVAEDGGEPQLSSVAIVMIEITDENDNQPRVSNVSTPLTFREGSELLSLLPNVVVQDEDSLGLRQITLSLSSPTLSSGSVGTLFLEASPPPSVVVRSQDTGRYLELTGTLSASEAEQILRTLTFRNSDLEPDSSTRLVDLTVSDSTFTTSLQIEIRFELVNDNPPIVDLDVSTMGSGYSTVFVEGGNAVRLTGEVAISDADSDAAGIASVTVELLNAQDGSLEILTFPTLPDHITVEYSGPHNHSITLTSLTPLQFSFVESLLSQLTYSNLADEPQTTPPRDVQVIVSDGELASSPAVTSVTFVLVNDPPRLNLGNDPDYQVEFVEGGGAVSLTSDNFMLMDSDNALLQNATVTLVNARDGNGERLVIGSVPTQLTITATNHTITLLGPAMPSAFISALQTVSYINDLPSPSSNIREVVFTVSDDQSTSSAITFVSFNLVNDPPVLDLNGPLPGVNYQVEFFEDTSPIPLASEQLTLRDVDSPFLSSANVRLLNTPDGLSEGLLITTSDGGAPVISQTPTEINIQGEATPEVYHTILQSIQYSNTEAEPTEGERVVEFIVSDGEANSSLAVAMVMVLQVNDPPILSLNNGDQFDVEYSEESPAVSIVNSDNIVIQDSDNSSFSSLLVSVNNVLDGNTEILGYQDPSSDNSLSVTQNTFPQQTHYQLSFSQESSGVTNFRALISSLTYRHSSQEPTAGTREIDISISDGVDTSPSQRVTVAIVLLNDNAPVFQQLFYQVQVSENLANVTAATVLATDDDSSTGEFGAQGTVIYSIESGNEQGFFSINPLSGVISLVVPLDREETAITPALMVRATNPVPLDNPLVSYPSSFVLVGVADANDNTPQFDQRFYEYIIMEHSLMGTIVGAVSAIDADVGTNAEIQYSIDGGNINSVFQINHNTGVISVANGNLLDRESVPQYTLSVTARDGGSPAISNTTVVAIRVEDINDNPPTFSATRYTMFTSESADIGTSVITVSATDRDIGSNADITYSLTGTTFFAINSNGTITTIASLDRESLSSHVFTVLATDSGDPQLSDSAEVTVTVLDINDNAPVFQEGNYTGSVVENSPSGQFVLSVLAIDADTGSNSAVRYSITGTTEFEIDPQTGVIVTNVPLDREGVALYQFQVIAQDGGEIPLQTSVSVSVRVDDDNDHTPRFVETAYSAQLMENLPPPQTLVPVQAMDNDIGSNAQITYSLVGGEGLFFVNPTSGVVVSTVSLDRELQSVYELEVVATDNGSPSRSSTVSLTVRVLDENDNAPVFDSTGLSFAVSEELTNDNIGTVTASDQDQGTNAEITFSIPESVPFAVHPSTGTLSLPIVLDREETAHFNFTVLATDGGGLTTSVPVSVSVLDINDNPPVFDPPTYSLTLSEDRLPSCGLLTLSATDRDAGANAALQYSLVSPVFSVDPVTGELCQTAALDAERETAYNLTILAQDGGTPPLSSAATVFVTILDINDNPIEIVTMTMITVYTEGEAPVVIAPDILVQDRDVSAEVTNASVVLVGALSNDPQLLVEESEEMVPFFSTSLVNGVELTVLGRPPQTPDFLQHVLYVNPLPEPTPHTLTAQFTVSDGVHIAVANVNVSIQTINDNPPVILLSGSELNNSVVFVEDTINGLLLFELAQVRDSDSDAQTLASIVAVLTNPLDEGLEFLTGQSTGAVSVFPPSGGHTLQLLGPASIEDFTAALATVRYHSNTDNPQTPLERLVQVTANDGDLLSEPSYVEVQIVPVNDPPSLELSLGGGLNTTYTEHQPPILLTSSGFSLTDPDSSMLVESTVTIINPLDIEGEFVLVDFPTPLTVTQLSNSELVITGQGFIAEYADLLQRVRYVNNATNPTSGAREIEFTVSDGELTAVSTAEVGVASVNDPPVVDLNGRLQAGIDHVTSFTEGGDPVVITSSDLFVEDTDSEDLSVLTVQILSPRDGASEILTVNSAESFLSIEYDQAAHRLEITGTASVTDYQSILLGVSYQNAADEPGGDDREISVVASDGELSSEPAIARVQFIRINDPPQVLLDAAGDFSTVFVENSPGVSIVNTRTTLIADVDSSTLTFLRAELTNLLDGELELLNVTVSISGLSLTTTLNEDRATYTFSFPSPAPVATFQQLLLSLTYTNLASEPNATLSRVITVIVGDGQLESSPVMTTISIALIDDNQPTFTQSMYAFELEEGTSVETVLGSVRAEDLDVGDQFLYQLSSLDTPFTVDGVSGAVSVSGVLDREERDTYTLTVLLTRTESPFSAFDDQAEIVVTILDVNDNTPVFNESTYTFSVFENVNVASQVGVVLASDIDIGVNAQLVYSLNQTVPFTIHPHSGAVTTSESLDREATPSYQFTVFVQDSGQPQLSSSAVVMVTVLDVNDHTPVFAQTEYIAELVDNTPVGSNLFQLSARDEDTGSNAQLSFSLRPPTTLLSVNASTGVILTADTFLPGSYNFTAVATDMGDAPLAGTALVSIQVVSFDSTRPQFTQSLYEGEVMENSLQGISILTISAQDPLNEGPITYSLPTASSARPFTLHPQTGVLSTSGLAVLDRESQGIYQFQVMATAVDVTRVGVASVAVRVTDANDFAPLFDSPSYTFTVSENVPGAIVGNVLARDIIDVGVNAQIVSYSSSEPVFVISVDGEVTVNGSLDRESRDEYVFIAMAVDGGSPALTGSASVTVNVRDVNDEPPVFAVSVFEGSIAERQDSGAPVLTLSATDSDVGSNAVVSYFTNHSLFAVHPTTGVLSTLVELDFESLGTIAVVNVYATDGGEPSLTATALARVTILDVDDTPPVFSQSVYIASVLEEQLMESFLLVNATDRDSGPDNPIVYSITGGGSSLFSIDSTGRLSVIQPLNREVTSQYSLTITASTQDFTGGTLSATAAVQIQVLDINDHSPQFTGEPYQFMVSESASGGELLGTLSATDSDVGSNANVSGFVIIEGDPGGIFDLDPQSGVLRIALFAILDRETMEIYTLEVEVSDGNEVTSLSSATNVSVTVTDINDQIPTFELQEYVASVRENSDVGLTFLTVRATDDDLGLNAQLSYSLSQPSSLFAINTTSGDVSLTGIVDFETQRQHMLTLLATDQGNPPLVGSASVTINIIDADDLPVVFTPDSFSGGVFENSDPSTPVLTVVAQDLDTVQSNPITYTLQDGVPFSIDSQSGLISVTGAVDRETVDSYVFQAFASNIPGISATATVTVEILDVNDLAPVFVIDPFEFQISESADIGTELGQVNASDADLESAGSVVEYSFVGSSDEFSIDPQSGVITLTQSVDFEQTPVYSLLLTARDGGSPALTGSAVAIVTVIDVNDNRPQFSMSSYTVTVAESESIGAVVFTAQATDADSGSNQQITYSLGESSPPQFTIDSQTGDVNVTAPLALVNYTLTIVATDSGMPPLADSAFLQIFVTDTNERPVFTQSSYSVTLAESEEVGSPLLQVSATDTDVGVNAQIVYSIQPQDVFVIDPQTGVIVLNQSLDFESVTSYSSIVIATDSGTPPLSSSASVLFTITDINDNRPVFSQSEYIVPTSESLQTGSEVVRVTATDRDSSANGDVTYSLVGGTTMFTINPLSGVITTLQQLDFELSQEITLSVMARDGGNPPQNSTVGVVVQVIDVDDNPPIFEQQVYRISTLENTTTGSVLLNVVATDRDSGENAVIQYHIVTNVSVPFQIDSELGEIILESPGLDRESVESYTLTIQAINPFSAMFTGTTTIQITVLDSNDNSPQFESNTFQFTISETSGIGTDIGTVTAQDADAGANAAITYSLQQASDFVSVVMETGELQVSGELDFEITPLIELTLIATDTGTPPLSTAVSVLVSLSDVNDVEPVVSFSQNQFVYQENSPAVNIGSGLTITDPDTFPLQSALLTLTLGSSRDSPTTDFIQLDRGFSESQGLTLIASTSLINITGNASPQIYSTVISRLQFGSTASEPQPGLRQVSVQVFDGLFSSNVGVISVTLNTINDNPPVLDLSAAAEGLGYQTVFTEGGSSVFLTAGDSSLTDLDGDDIQSVLVNLTNPLDGSLETITAIAFGLITIEATDHTILLTGPASTFEFDLALRTLTYSNRAGEPGSTQTPRFVEFTASDGLFTSEPAVTSVRIQAVNDPPSLLLGGTVRDITLIYSENDPNLPLFPPNFVLTDPDSEVISFVSVTVTNFEPGIDQFVFSSDISNLTVEVLSGTLLVSGPADIEEFESVLSTVVYVNTLVVSDQIESLQGGKVVQYTANDGLLSSQTATAFITFSAINDPPFIDLNGPDEGVDFSVVFLEGATSVSIVSPLSNITDSDSDNLLFLSAQLQNTQDGSQEFLSVSPPNTVTSFYNTSTFSLSLTGPAPVEDFQTALRTLTFQHTGQEPTPGVRMVTMVTSDGEATSLFVVSRITVRNINDPPLVIANPTITPFVESGPPVQLFDSLTLSDSDNDLLAFARVTIHNALDSALEVVATASQMQGVMVASSQSGEALSFTFTFTQPAIGTVTAFQSLLADLTYSNLAAEPASAPRNISLVVSDGVDLSDPVFFSLSVELINDNSPVFEDAPSQVELSENADTGSIVYQSIVTDQDADSTIFFSLLDNFLTFDISPATGLVTLAATLDREMRSSYVLTIEASDGTNTAQLVLPVVVLDVNDHSPEFDLGLYTAGVDENAPLGSLVTTVMATDEDTGTNAQLRYAISGGNLESVFAIDSNNGNITVAGSLDFERVSSYSLMVIARDMGLPVLSSTTFVVVSIRDENDNPPVFDPNVFSAEWNEDTAVSTVLYTAMAADRDAGGELTYSLVSGDAALFSVNGGTGEVVLSATLDYEMNTSHALVIQASDGSFTDTLRLTVVVRDVDDNPPMFEQDSYFVSISENASIGVNLLAGMGPLRVTDEDQGSNAVVQFVIESDDSLNLTRFAVNVISANTAELILIGRLDREVQDNYLVTIEARNPNNPSQNDTATVDIIVEDVNDSPPIFNSTRYVFTVQEDASQGTPVGVVYAQDMDIGTNALVTYSITSGDPGSNFIVTAEGEILVSGAMLDREQTAQYSLVVEASDGVLSTTTDVVITVLDVNDNPPQFEQALIELTLPENMPASTTLTTLTATDIDSGPNALVFYSVHPDNSTLFGISGDGTLFTLEAFDYETDPTTLLVVVIASDGGSPVLETEARVIVTLLDVNEFPPVFEMDLYSVLELESVAPMSMLVRTAATDLDGGEAGVIEYRIVSSIPQLPFAIDNATGDIVITTELDRETVALYEFVVSATNPLGAPPLTTMATVRVTLQDINDNPPQFSQSAYTGVITTRAAPGTVIVTVSAMDPDLGLNGIVELSLSQPSNILTFDQSTGTLSLISMIDSPQTIEVVVIATDQGSPQQSSNVTVTVNVVQPVQVDFEQEGAGFLLGESSPVQQAIGE